MAKQIIDTGTSANKGDGDPLRTAFRKINENFDELYAGNFAAPDATGSSLIPDTDATYDLGSADKQWADLYVKDFIYLNSARLETDANGNLRLNGAVIAADSQGSVFADDSTVLVDGVAGKIVGDIKNSLIETDNITALPGASDLFIQGGIYSGTPGNRARVNIGTTNTSTIILGAGDTDIYFNGTPGSSVVAGRLSGDLTGSVFADDSTLLVDGVSGTIPGYVSLDTLQTVVAASADFEDFQTRIAAL